MVTEPDYGDRTAPLLPVVVNAPVNTVTLTESDLPDTVGGKIKIRFTGVTAFSNHSYYFTVYPADPDTGDPMSTPLAQQVVEIDSDGNGEAFAQTFDTLSDCLFSSGTYYIGGIVDMNDNFTPEIPYDSGDRYGDYLPVVVNSAENVLSVAEEDYGSVLP